MLMTFPAATILGPLTTPASTACLRLKANPWGAPMSRTVVKPASSSFSAFLYPKSCNIPIGYWSIEKMLGSPLLHRWRWLSMSPGRTVLPAASTTSAPLGTSSPLPTFSNLSPLMTITASSTGLPPEPSMSLAPVIALTMSVKSVQRKMRELV